MNRVTRWLVVFGFIGIAGLILVQFPEAIGGLKTYRDEISSVSKLVAIAAAVLVVIRWLFFGSTESEKIREQTTFEDLNVKMKAGRDIINGDKKEEHFHNCSDTKINHWHR